MAYGSWPMPSSGPDGQGQSGQAIKLFQITPYVSDFQTLDNSGSWQTIDASKKIVFWIWIWMIIANQQWMSQR